MSPKTYTVSSSAQFESALNKAKGGDTISLRSGEYSVNIINKNFDSTLTITSANPDDPAVLVRSTIVKDSSNITLSNLEITPEDPIGLLPNSSSKAGLFIRGSQDIKLIDSYVHSRNIDASEVDEDRNLYEGYPFGVGIRVSDSKDVVLSGNEISQLHKGIGLWNTENVEILNNHLHHIRVDGIIGTDQVNTLITENMFNSFVPYRKNADTTNGYTDDHSDMIQYWGTSSKFGIDGFTVKNNVFIQDETLGGGNQTIFGRLNLRSTDDPDEISFSNFEISGNLIYNGAKNGLMVADVAGAKVFNNTIIPNKYVEEDFRNIPLLAITYDKGFAPGHKNFSLQNEDVQKTRDVDVYDNVLTYAFKPEIWIEAFDSKHNTAAEVYEALDIDVNGNNFLSSKIASDSSHEAHFKMTVEQSSDGMLSISLDSRLAEIHGDKGSAYYTDASALRDFLSKLNTSSTFSVDDTLVTPQESDAVVQGDLVASLDAPLTAASDDEVVQDEQGEAPASDKPTTTTTKIFEGEEVRYNFGVERTDEPTNLSGWTNSPSQALAHVYRIYENTDTVIMFTKVGTTTYAQKFDNLDFSITRVLMVLDAEIRDGKIAAAEVNGTLEELVLEDAVEEPTVDEPAVQVPVAKARIQVEQPSVQEPEPEVSQDAPAASDDISETLEDVQVTLGKTIGTTRSESFTGTDRADFIISNSGNDAVTGAKGHDKLYGNAGADTLDGGYHNDLLNGGSGSDLLIGDYGQDTLIGGNQDDILVGGRGNDSLQGSAGRDVIVLGGEAEDYDITLGRNWDMSIKSLKTGEVDRVDLIEAIYFQGSDALYNVNNRTGQTTYVQPSAEKDLYADLRSLEEERIAEPSTAVNGTLTMLGTNANDVLTGTNDNDIIKGLKGNDVIRGKEGDDLLIGNEGRDHMRGDRGNDMMLGGDGRDIIVGHRGDDLLLGGDGNDFVSGAMGRDIVVGGLGNDHLVGGSDIDTAVYSGTVRDYRITKVTQDSYKVLEKSTGDVDLLVDVERVYFEKDTLLGEIHHSGWVRELNKEAHSEDYAQFSLQNWASYTDEMVY